MNQSTILPTILLACTLMCDLCGEADPYLAQECAGTKCRHPACRAGTMRRSDSLEIIERFGIDAKDPESSDTYVDEIPTGIRPCPMVPTAVRFVSPETKTKHRIRTLKARAARLNRQIRAEAKRIQLTSELEVLANMLAELRNT